MYFECLVRVSPNKTVVPAGASSEMLNTVPLRSVRGLGGKLGEVVESWSKAKTVSDLKVRLSSGVTINGCRTTTTVFAGPNVLTAGLLSATRTCFMFLSATFTCT